MQKSRILVTCTRNCLFNTYCDGILGITPPRFAAQSFTLAVGAAITSASFTEIDYTRLAGPTGAYWVFYTASGGLPGTLLASGTAVIGGASNVGVIGGIVVGNMFIDTYSFNIPSVVLGPGTYFFAISAISSTFGFLAEGQTNSGAAQGNTGSWQAGYGYGGIDGIAVQLDGMPACQVTGSPCITSPPDGASPQSQFVALSGTGTADHTLNVLVAGVPVGAVVIDAEGNWEALPYVSPFGSSPTVQVRDQATFDSSNTITVHPSLGSFPPGPSISYTRLLPLRQADIFVDADPSSAQVPMYGPTYTHTALYLGGDADGTPWMAEAVTASEAGIWGQVRSVLLEQSLVWKAPTVSAFTPVSPLSGATRGAIIAWAANITKQGLPYWNVATDLTGPIVGSYALFAATGGLVSPRFNGFLTLLNTNKNSTSKFICSTLVWRSYWEGTSHTLDISNPNLMSATPGSVLGNLPTLFRGAFIAQLGSVFVVPETFVRSPKLRQVF